ncbi:Os10g0562100 [Oryza sativa Japonica Group]|jgi:hypothetical protein|uniref:Os10g0562100 protein n=1 Tax=Oryza sativa subsp. japonica TaxID=39947 RepID=A0A0P0XX87_ORYSJ|nr:hypothetical protein EE612_052794 [Oryza sativa]BAT12070.1 Os10g0562100 [Oryza sativa Japonica Group]
MEQHEEAAERKPSPPVIFRLFGVEVRGGGGGVDEEEYEEEEVEGGLFIKKSSSMPNLTSIDPLPVPADGGKRRASDDSELASGQQKRRRRKVQERKKGEQPPFLSVLVSTVHYLFHHLIPFFLL